MKTVFFLIACAACISCCSPGIAAAQDGASNYLYEYGVRLYQEGNVYDAIHQLKNALLVNPRNTAAKDYLNKIFAEQQAENQELYRQINKDKIEELSTKISQLEEEKQAYQGQVTSLQDRSSGSEAQLQKLNQDLQSQRGLLGQEQERLHSTLKGNEGKIEELKRQVAKTQEDERQYQQQVSILQNTAAAKDNEVAMLKQELESYKDRHVNELTQKEKALDNIKTIYENKLRAINEALETKDANLKDLDGKTRGILEESKRTQEQQIAKVDKIMREIEEILPEIKNPPQEKQELSMAEREIDKRQVERIERIMRKIKEILPKS